MFILKDKKIYTIVLFAGIDKIWGFNIYLKDGK